VLAGLAAASGLLLVIGFLTPFAGVVLVVSIAAGRLAGSHEAATSPLLVGIAAIALVLLGPGAVSLDARLFGRREIVIPRGGTQTKS